MRKLPPSRRLIALLATYLIALQAVVLPLAVAAHGASAIEQGLCLSTGSGGGQGPAGHDEGCACAAGCGMQCHAPALADTPPVALTGRLPHIGAIAPALPIAAVDRPAIRSPLLARAPPLA